jgi:hypothetical protein
MRGKRKIWRSWALRIEFGLALIIGVGSFLWGLWHILRSGCYALQSLWGG